MWNISPVLNYLYMFFWLEHWRHHRGVLIVIIAQLHSTKPELTFCAGLNPARDMSEISDGENLWQWFRLEIRLNTPPRSTILQKQLI